MTVYPHFGRNNQRQSISLDMARAEGTVIKLTGILAAVQLAQSSYSQTRIEISFVSHLLLTEHAREAPVKSSNWFGYIPHLHRPHEGHGTELSNEVAACSDHMEVSLSMNICMPLDGTDRLASTALDWA